MYLKVSFDQDFDDFWMYLKNKYPKKLFDLDGVGKQTDISDFSKAFFTTKTTTADVSVDDNSNVTDMTIVNYQNELPKAIFKYNSYYVLWKKLKQLYGPAKACDIVEQALTGSLYINDFHGIASGHPYCFNYSTFDIMLHGLPMVTKIKSVAPKYLYSFKSQLEQFVVIASNSTLGATGLADMFIVMGHYVDKIFSSGHDAGFYFSGWFSPEEDNVRNLSLSEYIKMKTETEYLDELSETEYLSLSAKLSAEYDMINEKITKRKEPHYKTTFEKAVWKYIKENIVSFIYTINQPARGGAQSPFTNVSIYDDVFLNDLLPGYSVDGHTPDKERVKKIQEIYLQTMNEELERTQVTFPVTTACFCVDDDNKVQDENFLKFISKENLRFGFINIYCGKTSTLSSCCRLRSNTENPYFNSFGAGSTKIGSLGVATINMPRLAYKHNGNEEAFFEELRVLVNDAAKINHAKRKIIEKRIENGNHPLYTLGFIDLKKQYSTCGLTGVWECLTIMGYDILNKDGQDFLFKCLETITIENEKNEKQYLSPHNIEQIPAESTAAKLAAKDKLLKYQSEEYQFDIYSNQFIPLIKEADMLERIKIQGIFDSGFSGGAIAHINIDSQIEDPQQIEDLIRVAIEAGVIYFAINYKLLKCENEHMSVGNEEKPCAVCGAAITDTFTRVVGYLVNTKNFNQTRREIEYPNRIFYQPEALDETIAHPQVFAEAVNA